MFTKFINIAIAVNDIDAAIARFHEAYGFGLERDVFEQPGLGIRAAVLSANGVSIELLSPLPGEKVLRKFLDTRGEGVYRMAFASNDVDGVIDSFQKTNVPFVDVSGAASLGHRILFTHPKAAHGLMVEVVERDE
ncbi:MAG: VOC family protein [Dehalococcoidia bacterium]